MNEPLIFRLRPLKAANTLFLDRDGVLNEAVIRKSEVSSPRCLEEFKIADDIDALGAPEIVHYWNLVVVSNQPDLARGTIELGFLEEIHWRINRMIPLNAVYICPHEESDGCTYRKPGIGLIRQFRIDYPELRGEECMVGDRISDWDCSLRAGIPFILRKRPYNRELVQLTPLAIDNLWELKTLLDTGVQ